MVQTKRKQSSGKQKGPAKTKQPKQDGQKAVSRDIDVPIDEGFHEDRKSISHVYPSMGRFTPLTSPANVSIYIDPEGIIHDASLNQTNIGNNNNKVGVPNFEGSPASSM